MEKQVYFYGTGRRKTAVARVKVFPGNGAIIINGTPYEETFTALVYQRAIQQPLVATESTDKYNVVASVTGGGINGQSDAICHGIARALARMHETHRLVLRQNGLLTRDARAKERKKAGLKRARKAPQYTKR